MAHDNVIFVFFRTMSLPLMRIKVEDTPRGSFLHTEHLKIL